MLVRFWVNHHLLDLVQRPCWRVVKGRSKSYVDKVLAGEQATISHINTHMCVLVLIISELPHWDCQQQRLQVAVDWHATLVTTEHHQVCPSLHCALLCCVLQSCLMCAPTHLCPV